MKTALLYLALVTAGVSGSVAIGYQWARAVALADALDAQLHASVHSAVLRDSLRVARTTVRVDSVAVHTVVTRWRSALALSDQRAIADSVRLVALAAQQTRTERALVQSQARSWRHRLEGVVACGAATYGIHRLTQD